MSEQPGGQGRVGQLVGRGGGATRALIPASRVAPHELPHFAERDRTIENGQLVHVADVLGVLVHRRPSLSGIVQHAATNPDLCVAPWHRHVLDAHLLAVKEHSHLAFRLQGYHHVVPARGALSHGKHALYCHDCILVGAYFQHVPRNAIDIVADHEVVVVVGSGVPFQRKQLHRGVQGKPINPSGRWLVHVEPGADGKPIIHPRRANRLHLE
mmetsp:Transcript_32278/g.57768  ORF Transcript_32278/g.57768 Transcript_32278/m.57768 type:complete len:212 (-) Transcript_32278:156-791(-)